MRILWRVLVVLVVVGAIVGLGFYAYNVGLASGQAQAVPVQGGQVPVAPYPYFWHPFWGFGFLSCLIPLFLLFLVFGSLRVLFWRGPMGMRRHWHHGPWGWRDPEGKGVPPFFEEWHRRAHGEPEPPQDQQKM